MNRYIKYIKGRVEGRKATIREKYFFRIYLIIKKLEKYDLMEKINLD